MENSCTFDFAAPQYLESLPNAANLAEKDGADSFFDMTSQLVNAIGKKEEVDLFQTPIGTEYNKDDKEASIQLPIRDDGDDDDEEEEDDIDNNKENQINLKGNEDRQIIKARRKTMKPLLKTPLKGEVKYTFDGIEVMKIPFEDKEHTMMTRQDKLQKTQSIQLRTRQVVKEATKRKASSENERMIKRQNSKFISLAEKIMHFQVDTPPRFKTKVNVTAPENKNPQIKATIPNSPNLLTKARARTTAGNIQSQEDQKYNFKATKLNMKIFEKPDINERPKSRSTVPKPFNLTDCSKKDVPVSKEVFQFKAKPAPKSLTCSESPITSSTSLKKGPKPYAVKRGDFNDNAFIGVSATINSNTTVEVKPFSFDERDKEMMRKKEEKLKKLQEEEARVPVFHANPVPAYITNSWNSTLKSCVSTTSLASNASSTSTSSSQTFKAKFPSVLYREPFTTHKSERHATDAVDLNLNTERRAHERKDYEKDLQTKMCRLDEERQRKRKKRLI